MENNPSAIKLATEKLKPSLSVQKQFDTLTSAINLFDISFLVSGAAMLGVCFLAFPKLIPMCLHREHLFLSIMLCILFAYIFGLVSRIMGKEVARWQGIHSEQADSITNETFVLYFKDIVGNNSPLYKMLSSNAPDVVFSYMWMKLDTGTNRDCRTRFLYVSRVWVLRAIFEGLIAPTMFLSLVVCINCFKPILPLFVEAEQTVGGAFLVCLIPLVFALSLFVVYLLAKEANHCAKTLMREVVVAYFDFFEGKRKDE